LVKRLGITLPIQAAFLFYGLLVVSVSPLHAQGRAGTPYTDAFPHVYTVYESDFEERGASDEVRLFASCDLGDVAISGGYSFGGQATGSGFSYRQEVTIVMTALTTILQDNELNPDFPPDSWFVHAISSPDFPEDTAAWTLHVSVNCVRNRHPRHGQQ